MEKKQTAVEWLEEQIKDIFYVAEASEMTKKFKSVYDQAKQMEKEQRIDFSKKCLDKALDTDIRTAHLKVEQYYDETYGGKNG
jgi:hypothetical protein